MQYGNVTRNIDIVFCIDGTGSMRPIMDDIKENAIRFYGEVVEECYAHGASVAALRVKLLIFRDYESEGGDAIIESPFYELPSDDDLFADFLKTVVPGGGAGKGACGYEALHYAFRSEFVSAPKDRQIIVLISDTYPRPLPKRSRKGYYPGDMSTEEELINTWTGAIPDPEVTMTPRGRRLIFFAPGETDYRLLAGKLKGAIFVPVAKEKGLRDTDFSSIVKVIAASAGGQ